MVDRIDRPMLYAQVAAIRVLSCKSVLSHILTRSCFACGPLHASAYADEVDAHFQSCLVCSACPLQEDQGDRTGVAVPFSPLDTVSLACASWAAG